MLAFPQFTPDNPEHPHPATVLELPVNYQKLLLQHLELIDRVVQYIARKHHLQATDAEEFSSIVRYKLIDRDFAILRKFQGRSNLATYLTTVIERLYLDFCIQRWGKWRPSAAARRLGAVATLLEQLIVRDGLTFEEAVGTLQTNHGVTESREQLHGLLVQLPMRVSRRTSGEEELALVPAHGSDADISVDHSEDSQVVDRVEAALARAIDALPPQDQLIIRLRFLDNLPVAQIGRALAIDFKVLYRRLEQIMKALRAQLQQEGIDHTHIERIVGHPALTVADVLPPVTQTSSENGGLRPSKR